MWGLLILYFIAKYQALTSRILYNISIGAKYFALQTNILYTCSYLSVQMETLTDNLSAKAIIIDL